MSNWTSISADDLKAYAVGNVVDTARTKATGGNDPVTEVIADAIAKVRRAVSAANTLDQDAAKVPNSLKGLTVRMALFALMERIGLPLKEDQRDTKRQDGEELRRITESKLRVEAPDTPAGSGEMQEHGAAIAAVNVPTRLTGRGRTSGL